PATPAPAGLRSIRARRPPAEPRRRGHDPPPPGPPAVRPPCPAWIRGAAVSVFRIEWPERGIAHLVMDDPERKLNVLDEGAIGDLETSLRELERAAELKGVVLRSGKPGSFVAGADVNAIASITDSAQVV